MRGRGNCDVEFSLHSAGPAPKISVCQYLPCLDALRSCRGGTAMRLRTLIGLSILGLMTAQLGAEPPGKDPPKPPPLAKPPHGPPTLDGPPTLPRPPRV